MITTKTETRTCSREVVKIKREEPQIFIDNIVIASDSDLNPDHLFLEAFVSNTSDTAIALTGAALVRPRGEEFLCCTDDFGTYGGKPIPTEFPIMLAAHQAIRVTFQFEHDPTLTAWVERIRQKNKKFYLRFYTDTDVFGSLVQAQFEPMEDWYWKWFDRKRRQEKEEQR